MTENRRILLNIVATYGRSLYGIVLGLLCGRWSLMILGQTDFGLYGVVGCMAGFIGFFSSVLAGSNARFFAISVGAAKNSLDSNEALAECRRWFNTAFAVHAVLSVFLVAIGFPIGNYAIQHWLTIPPDRIPSCLVVFRYVCVSCFAGMFFVPFSAMFTAKQYIAELTIYSFATMTSNVFVLHYMLTHPLDWFEGYAAWMCVMAVMPQILIAIRAIFVFPECRIVRHELFSAPKLKQLCRYAGWTFLGMFCGLLRTNGMMLVINRLFGAGMNAAQSIGNTVQTHCCSLAGSMQNAFVPVITQACGSGDYRKMNAFALRTCKFNMLLSLLFIIPLSLEMPEIIRLWLAEPPPYATGFCYMSLLYYFAGCCTVGHMVVVCAVGKLSGYYLTLGGVNILTLPLAIVVGLWRRNVYEVMAVVVFMEILNSIGRVCFARRHAKTSVKSWAMQCMLPVFWVSLLAFCFGSVFTFCFKASFLRVCMTTAVSELVFLPLSYRFVLSKEERDFVKLRMRRVLYPKRSPL